MDVIFCDLCNESVPLNDLQEGRAVRRGARVVCAACEKSMSAALHPVTALPADAGLSSPESAAPKSAAQESATPETAARATRGSSSGAWVGLLVLGVGALALHRVDQRMQAVENQQGMQREDLAKARAGAQLAREEAQLLRTANTELAGRLSNSEQNTAMVRTELEKLVAADRARSEEQIAKQVENSDALRRSLEAQLLERERRIEELGMRLAKSEDAQLALQQRLDDLVADALAQREAPPAVGQPQPQAAAWHALLPRLQDENPSVRWQAVDELSRAGDPAVLDSVVGCLQDKDLFVRMRAAGALGELKLDAAVPALLDALADSEPMVREAACQSLKLVTGRDPRFDPLASDAEREKRLRALREAYPAPRAAPGAAPANPQGS